MLYLFIDESGDHNLIKIDQQYPVFVLAGVIIEEDYHNNQLTNVLNSLKTELFNTTDIILHTADITRNKNGFEALKDTFVRERFFDKLNEFMSTSNYSVVAAAIKKVEHKNKYGKYALDPYHLCLEILIERFVLELKARSSQGWIIAEKRDSLLDRQLRLAYDSLLNRGTRFLRPSEVKKSITNFILKDKKENFTGLQIADLVATPIGRYVLGKQTKKDFDIVKSKFRRNYNGDFIGYGLVVLP